MSTWQTMESAPKDRNILVFGRPTNIEGCTFLAPGVHIAYWDPIDGSYCLKGATWLGPFIEPTHWADEPAPPLPGESNARFIAGPATPSKR